jgi:2-iminobutanoate/2-iminopropanoate deaminase
MAELAEVRVDRPWAEGFRYSAATRVGDLVFVSGQVGVDDRGETEEGFLAQAHRAFENLRDVLTAAGTGMDRIAKVTIYLTDVEQFAHVPDLRAQYFSAPYPADTTVVVRSLARPGLLVEIEAIAAV